MKTMNYLLAIAMLCVVGSCSKETPVENEDLAAVDYRGRIAQEEEKSQEIFKVDFQQYYVLGQLAILEKQKRELEEQIGGGDEKQIPTWESVTAQININTEILGSILASSCSILKLREQLLKTDIIFGNMDAEEVKEAKEALEEIRKKIRGCGLSLPGYINGAMDETIILAIIGGKIGENCHPGIDFKTCIPKLNNGTLLINSIDGLGGDIEVYFKSSEGEIISKGEMVGLHHELEGVSQSAIELESIKNGVLVFKDKNGSFSQVINVE